MLNNVSIIGRMCADPELKHTPQDVPVCTFSIACQRNYVKTEKITDFFNIVAWRGNAEFISKYFSRGSMIAITGQLQTRKYTDSHGYSKTATEILAETVSFCDSKKEVSGATERPVPTEDVAELMPVEDEDIPF